MPKFRKKPVVIEAEQLTPATMRAVCQFIGRENILSTNVALCEIEVKTLEGGLRASPNDWIIKGVNGEFYPCKPDIFAATYGPVVDA